MVMEGMVWLVLFLFIGLAAGLETLGRAGNWQVLGMRFEDVVVVGGGLTWDGAAGTVTARAESRCCDAMENMVSTVLLWRYTVSKVPFCIQRIRTRNREHWCSKPDLKKQTKRQKHGIT